MDGRATKASDAGNLMLIVGAGGIGRGIVERLGPAWQIRFLDLDAGAGRDNAAPGVDSIDLARGDGSSRQALERAGAAAASVVLATTGDDAVNVECARLAREAFGVRRVLAVVRDPSRVPELVAAGVEPVVASAVVADWVQGRLEPTLRPAFGVGLGQGEILEVTLLPSSPAIGRVLRSLGAREWLVAAVYRGDQLIIPHGDTVLANGDRVILVGDPRALPAVAEFFRAGASAFPLPYGRRFAALVPTVAPRPFWEEVDYLARSTSASGIDLFSPTNPGRGEPYLYHEARPGTLADQAASFPGVGCFILPGEVVEGSPSCFRAALAKAPVPLLVARGQFPYRRVMLAVFDYAAARVAAEVAIGLADLWGVPLSAVAVVPPALVAGQRAVAEPLEALTEATMLARIRRVRIAEQHLSGNPIRRIVDQARIDADLLIVGRRRRGRWPPFQSDVAGEIAARTSCSTLVVPLEHAR